MRKCRSGDGDHQLDAEWIETIPVREEWQGQVVWDGSVEAFSVDHPATSRAYAWSHSVGTGTRRRFYTVLGIPPINSALDAVRTAIASGA